MNAMVRAEVMDWGKFTAEEWFQQYGAYIQTCRMKSGNEPDSLRINQIYWLICENGKGVPNRKDKLQCLISDYEAEQVRKLICDLRQSKMICVSAKIAVELFIEKNVRGMSLRQLADEYKMGKTSVENMVFAGKYYLNGHDKRLKI